MAGSVISSYHKMRKNENRIAQVDNWQVQYAAIKERKMNYQEQLDEIYLHIPESDRISRIVEMIYGVARSEGIRIHRIQPGEYSLENQFLRIPLLIKTMGHYHGLGRFINGLEQSNYIVETEQAMLQRESLHKSNISAELLLNIYVIRQ